MVSVLTWWAGGRESWGGVAEREHGGGVDSSSSGVHLLVSGRQHSPGGGGWQPSASSISSAAAGEAEAELKRLLVVALAARPRPRLGHPVVKSLAGGLCGVPHDLSDPPSCDPSRPLLPVSELASTARARRRARLKMRWPGRASRQQLLFIEERRKETRGTKAGRVIIITIYNKEGRKERKEKQNKKEQEREAC